MLARRIELFKEADAYRNCTQLPQGGSDGIQEVNWCLLITPHQNKNWAVRDPTKRGERARNVHFQIPVRTFNGHRLQHLPAAAGTEDACSRLWLGTSTALTRASLVISPLTKRILLLHQSQRNHISRAQLHVHEFTVHRSLPITNQPSARYS
jgi:hypothetical protein